MPDASQTTAPFLTIREVSKHYRDGQVQALGGVSLDIGEGDFVAIMGPSGCGKSTLLHMLGALDLPTRGEVLFRGQSLSTIANLDQLRAKEFGFVFQSFYLLPNLTAEENVQLPMFGGKLRPAERTEAARKLLTQVGLADRMQHLPDQLSNGQRQRVAIARALANNPSVVLADEPTGALDSRSGQEVMQILADLNRHQGTTLVIVTHDANVASRARRVIELLDGQIAKIGSPNTD
jgi:ABC-type lipoprotein export system ATPase subunit